MNSETIIDLASGKVLGPEYTLVERESTVYTERVINTGAWRHARPIQFIPLTPPSIHSGGLRFRGLVDAAGRPFSPRRR